MVTVTVPKIFLRWFGAVCPASVFHASGQAYYLSTDPRNLAGNPDSPQAVSFLTSTTVLAT